MDASGPLKGWRAHRILAPPGKSCSTRGSAPTGNPEPVYLTHKHTDHTSSLPHILSCRSGLRPVYMPEPVLRPLAALQKAIRWLCDGDEEPDISSAMQAQGCDPHIVDPGTTFNATKNLHVEVLAAYHDTQSVGYGFSRVKHKLKGEYAGLSGKKLEHFERRVPVSPRRFSNLSCAFSATRTFKILGTTMSGASTQSWSASARARERQRHHPTTRVSRIWCRLFYPRLKSSGF